ncbi:hypothetical protein GDO78_002948 [Eleutherodactylus coqui]|uniref:5-azacytidine-induced protein 2 n=1 Tax=Eleutherodactylus coqui TaxID=57060 RepID=A0A8J6EWQ6_ELECQ|nr:hypothetical protein GDO78_002948 [Eleutherodactylus coqui]
MDSFLDDDIRILTREKKSYIRKDDSYLLPIARSTGEASHFALLCGESSMGESDSDKVNKAFSAFREISIERDQLKKKLSAVEKEKMEFTKNVNEQLQSKEVELLQVKCELETHQVMKSLSKSITDWEIEKLNSELKIRSVEQELKLLQEECGRLRAELERTKNPPADGVSCNKNQDNDVDSSESGMRQAYWELKKEMSNLHLVTEVQAEVLRKLKGTVAATKKASRGPVQCEEDLERTFSKLRITAGRVTYQKMASPKEQELHSAACAPPPSESTLSEKPETTQGTIERPVPLGGTDCDETDSYQKSGSEENSWVIPSPPKPSETLFWEIKNASSSPGQYYNPNYTFES